MTALAHASFASLALRFHQEPERLFAFFPEAQREALAKTPALTDIDFPSLLHPEAWLHAIHYSWLYKPLLKMPPPLQLLVCALLDQEEGRKLQALLKNTAPLKPPPPAARVALLLYLKKELSSESVLPTGLLPASPLNALLSLTKQELTHLTHLLGLNDLASELRYIVDKTLLSKIDAALTKEERTLLTHATKQPLKWTSPQLAIDKWDGKRESLYAALHKKGIFRLAKALYGEEGSLRWHVAHRLDVGRGELLLKMSEEREEERILSSCKKEVLYLLGRYSK